MLEPRRLRTQLPQRCNEERLNERNHGTHSTKQPSKVTNNYYACYHRECPLLSHLKTLPQTNQGNHTSFCSFINWRLRRQSMYLSVDILLVGCGSGWCNKASDSEGYNWGIQKNCCPKLFVNFHVTWSKFPQEILLLFVLLAHVDLFEQSSSPPERNIKWPKTEQKMAKNGWKLSKVAITGSVCVCVCVFSSHPFWTSSSLDVPAGVTQEEGHTGFLIHLPSAVRALIFVARRIQPFLSLVDREVEFCVLTN